MPFTAKKLTPIDTSSLKTLGAGTIDLSKYVEEEFSEVAKAIQSTEADTVWNRAPPRPRRGTTVYADGTNWNPGSGEGPYFFDGTSYNYMKSAIAGDAPLDGNTYGRKNGAWVRVLVSVKRQVFTASGTYTPSVGMVYCIVEGVGSGGGGAGVAGTTTAAFGSGGGGAGGYSRLVASAATIGVSQVVTIGNAGSGGAAGANNGTAGGDCSLGVLLIAKGGSGGFFCSGSQLGIGGAGGIAGTGDIIAAGQPGTSGLFNTTRGTAVVLPIAGNGGSSIFGGGGVTMTLIGTVAVAGTAAGNYGSGGSGAFSDATAANAAGGNGSKGIIIVTEYCSQ